jgi:hypothetical protein
VTLPLSRSAPFAEAVGDYTAAGWPGVLPLPARAKKNPPSGFTGRDGAWPTTAQLTEWAATRPDANVALRMPETVLGIDVDAYGDKLGAATLADHEARLGALPATWTITSRTDGLSGIRLFRVPAGMAWPSQVGGPSDGIEVLRTAHRYAVAPPSLHPEGRVYHWVSPDGETADRIPAVAELPDLPDAWVAGLTGGQAEETRRGCQDVPTWLAGLTDGEPDPDVARIVAGFAAALTDGGSRHEAMRAATWELAVAGATGGHGVPSALAQAEALFLDACAGDRNVRETRREWDRALSGAVSALADSDVPVLEPFDVPADILAAWEARRAAKTARTTPADGGKGRSGDGDGRLTADDVVTWIEANFRLGRSTDGLLFAVPTYPGSNRIAREVRAIRSDVLRRFREDRKARTGRGVVIGSETMTAALGLVAALAEDAQEHPETVALRAAQVGDDRVFLDLGTTTGRVVEVTPAGWSVVDPSPSLPLFRRSAAVQPLPEPVHGGSMDTLRELLGLDAGDRRWLLVRGWLVGSLFSEVPRPLLWATGSQGSGKSTRARMLLSVIEPTDSLGKEPGRNERDDSTGARGRFLVSYDNVTTVSQATSDWLCRLVTGVTDDRRALYSDDDLRPVSYRRSGVATSITLPPGLGSDALERIALVPLDRVPDDERRGESGLWAAFHSAHPEILGAVLADVARVLRHLEDVKRESIARPRMADYADVLRSLDRALGMEGDAGHLAAYVGTVDESLADRALDDPFTAAVLALVDQRRGHWHGRPDEFLPLVTRVAGDFDLPPWWPANPRALGIQLRRASETLRHAGVVVTAGKSNGARWLDLQGTGSVPATDDPV